MPFSPHASQGSAQGPWCPCSHLQGLFPHRFLRGTDDQQVIRQVIVSRAVLGFEITLKVR